MADPWANESKGFSMPTQRKSWLSFQTILLGFFCCSYSFAVGPNMSLLPVSSTGPFVIIGNEIRTVPGATISMEFYISDWAGVPGHPQLLGIQATIDPAGYLGANAQPANPGADLIPVGYALPDPAGGNRPQGLFTVLNVCSLNGRECSGSCALAEGFCVMNPRWVCGSCAPHAVASWDSLAEYSVGCVCQTGGVADPDDLNREYFGTLRLVIPANASGTYTVAINPDPYATLFLDGFFISTGIRTFTPTKITVGAGACCMPGGSCSVLSATDCDLMGGTMSGDFDCGGDPDGDLVPSACDPCPLDTLDDQDGDGLCDSVDGCPLDPNKTDPGICGCGVSDGDSDFDTVPDCLDLCAGLDDTVDSDGDAVPDCAQPVIPAISTWGLAITTLLLLVGAKLAFGVMDNSAIRVHG